MNIDALIEQIHQANEEKRRAESGERRTTHVRRLWRIAIPSAAVAAAAVLLIVLLPRGNKAQAATPAPVVYCSSQCNADDVMALIDNNINHIKKIKSL